MINLLHSMFSLPWFLVAVSQGAMLTVGFVQVAYLWGWVCFKGWPGCLAIVVPLGVDGGVGLFLVDEVDEVGSDEVLV